MLAKTVILNSAPYIILEFNQGPKTKRLLFLVQHTPPKKHEENAPNVALQKQTKKNAPLVFAHVQEQSVT